MHSLAACFLYVLLPSNLLSPQFKRREIIILEWMQTVIEHFSVPLHKAIAIVCLFEKLFLLAGGGKLMRQRILSVGIISFMSSDGPFFIDRHAHIPNDFHIENKILWAIWENYLNWNRCWQMKRKKTLIAGQHQRIVLVVFQCNKVAQNTFLRSIWLNSHVIPTFLSASPANKISASQFKSQIIKHSWNSSLNDSSFELFAQRCLQ